MSKHDGMNEVVAAWKSYFDTLDDWRKLIEGVSPKVTGFGLIYELPNPIDRPSEGFAIADMREIEYAAPHYHTGNETEIYIVLSGSGMVVVGGDEYFLQTGDTCITHPETAHFTIPKDNLVLAVINTPPFEAKNVVMLEEKQSRSEVGYSADQLLELMQKP